MHMYIEDRKILKEGDEKYMYSGWNLFFFIHAYLNLQPKILNDTMIIFWKIWKNRRIFFRPLSPPPCLFPPRITLQKLILCQTPLLLSLALVSLSKINYRLWNIPERTFCFADCPEIIQISICELHSDSDFCPRNAVMTIHNHFQNYSFSYVLSFISTNLYSKVRFVYFWVKMLTCF